MCPVYLATMGLFVAGAASTGGLAALAFKLSRKKNEARRHRDDDEHLQLPRLCAQRPR
jgi:hypothetical protein